LPPSRVPRQRMLISGGNGALTEITAPISRL
jgi:hypothetical protein